MVKQVDPYTSITRTIIRQIEAGADEYKMPWNNPSGSSVPVNAVTGKAYNGINILYLWSIALEKNYSSSLWAGFHQWKELGAHVRKDERATIIMKWNAPKEEDDDAKDGTDKRKRYAYPMTLCVFNADQVDGYTPPIAPHIDPATKIERAERFFANVRADVRHGGDQAFYSPSKDIIALPPFQAFRDAVSYYSVRAHETAHWTGATHRLDRNLKGRFGDEAYAMEELVAELAAAYTMADLGLAVEPRSDHAAYIATWLKVLNDDPRAIVTASSKAQGAVDFQHDLQPDPEAEAWRDQVAKDNFEAMLADPRMQDPDITELPRSLHEMPLSWEP